MFVTPASQVIYNWFKRYNVQAADMTAFIGGLVASQRGTSEGLTGAAILEGFSVALTGGLNLTAGTGIAVGPSGYLDVVASVTPLSVPAPTAGTRRSLIVIQPNLVPGTTIQDPVTPTQTDTLTLTQQAIVSVIAGVAANSPSYPAVPAGATVLCGIRTTTGQANLATSDIDFSVQDTIGKNSSLENAVGGNDARLQPYRQSNQLLGIRPSQIEPPLPRLFTYITPGTPSIFPKSAGLYNPADTFLNFQSGAITGGDTTTPAFTPQIPSAGNAIVATVGIAANDTIAVAFGTVGTRAQCFAAIKNQTLAGAGGLSLPFAKLVSFVVLTSSDGANITELDFFDARSFSAFLASAAYPGYDVVVGGAGVNGATHATLAAAVADAAVTTNKRVLLADSQAIAPVALTKAGWRIDALPGVTYTKGSGTTGLTMQAANLELRGLRMAGYTVAGNKAITSTAAWVYGRVYDCAFAVGTDTDIDDSAVPAGKKPFTEHNFAEI